MASSRRSSRTPAAKARLGHAPGYRVPRDVGQGKFDAMASIMAVPMHDVLLGPYHVASVALL